MICDEIQANIELHATGDLAGLDAAADRSVRDHLAACPACRRLATQTQGLFHRLDAALRHGPQAGPSVTPIGLPSRILAAVKRDRSRRRFWGEGLAAAACLLAAMGGWRIWGGGGGGRHPPGDAPKPAELIACQVRSMKPSQFEVIGPRRIRLDWGTILLSVDPSSQPLVVQTPAGEATALGTEFSVQCEAVEHPPGGQAVFLTTVEVLRGAVRLKNAQGTLVAGAGETMEARSNTAPMKRPPKTTSSIGTAPPPPSPGNVVPNPGAPANVSMSHLPDDAKVSRGVYGQVVSVTDDGKIVVKVGDKEVTVTTDAKTVVTLEGKGAKVSDLKKDLWVVVTPGEGTATKIVASEKPGTRPAPGGNAPGGATGAPQNPA